MKSGEDGGVIGPDDEGIVDNENERVGVTGDERVGVTGVGGEVKCTCFCPLIVEWWCMGKWE